MPEDKNKNIKKPLLSVIAPMYNEEGLVEVYCNTLIAELEPVMGNYSLEVLLVDDGSKDSTWEKMLEMKKVYPHNITLIKLSRNFGLEGAVNAGLKKAAGDVIVAMDADLQDPPSIIIKLLKKYEEGFDVVVAKRAKRENDNVFKRYSAKLYYYILDKLSGKLTLENDAANFRLLSRKALDILNSLPEVNPVFRVTVPFIGTKTGVVEYERDKRYAGKTKYKLASMVRYALNSLTGISVEPLRKIFYLMLIEFAASFVLLLLWLFGEKFYKDVYIILFAITVSSALILLAISIIAEYIAQLFLETKKRPISIIYDYIPFEKDNEE